VDPTTKIGVLAGGAALVALLVFVRFCGDVTVAPRPGKPAKAREKSVGQVTRETNADTETYLKGIASDAARAGLPVPSLEDLGKVFAFQRDDRRFTLVPDAAAVDIAGLRIAARSFRAAGSEKLLVLEITNPGASPIAYQIETEISGGDPACFGRTILEHNAMVVAPGKTERRSECEFKRGLEVYVARVETAVLSPFAAFYVSRLQPQAVGARERIANGHKPVGVPLCGLAMSASIRSALSEGSVRWRDLVDFYARHSCEIYQFPMEYKAFTSDQERPLPDVGE
jgi:hypothetical protein